MPSDLALAAALALSSAALHAAWNLFVKTSTDRDLAAWGQFLAAGIMVLPALAVLGWPVGTKPGEPSPYAFLVASGLVHAVYVTALVKAYTHGDFSLVYPLARGGGAMLAALGGVMLLGDSLHGGQWLAIAVVGGGLLSLIRRGSSVASIWWAVLTALTIATYTLIDSQGSRVSDSGVLYGFALMPLSAVTISATNIARGRLGPFVRTLRTAWWRYMIAGALLTTAYTLVLVAVRFAPVGYVSMLRESSVVMGALAGWLFLHEKLGKHRLVSSVVIVAGLVMLILFR